MAILVGNVVGVLTGSSEINSLEVIHNFLGISSFSTKNQVVILGLITLFIFLLRPIVVLPISRKIIFAIHRSGADLTNALFSKFTSLSLKSLKVWSSSDVNYSLTVGVSSSIRLLWVAVTLISDFTLVLMFFIALFISNYLITIGLLVYVLILFGILNWINGSKISDAGIETANTTSNATKNIFETLGTFRELYVSNKIKHRLESFRINRIEQGDSLAIFDWLKQVPRYVIDTALILGILIIAIGQLNSTSIEVVASSTTLYLTAALRILPTIAPIQNSVNEILNSSGMTFKLKNFYDYVENEFPKRIHYLNDLKNNNSSFRDKNINVHNLNFKHSDKSMFSLKNINFTLEQGKTMAIIGSSGSGKTTLADCLLGLLEITAGNVTLFGQSPEEFITSNSNNISYVSQDVFLIDGSVLENVAFAIPEELINIEKVNKVLKSAHIFDFVQSLPQGLQTVVGERGTRLSGGQRQRIGIARALYSDPLILVLDEATSSLDAETEYSITSMLRELKGEVTIISIAHRLSTVMHSDLVLFLKDGTLAGSGKFEELIKQHPDLARQAELLGLNSVQN
jgi:ATP-binding cassette subfamily C protein